MSSDSDPVTRIATPDAGTRRWRETLALCLPLLMFGAVAMSPARRSERPVLRVCADPNNLPFSDSAENGFENRIASLIARDRGQTLEYTWWPARRGFIRNTLRVGKCDLVMGVPSSYELVLPSRPYYRSSYVFVTRADRKLAIRSFDDSVLRRLRIGVHMIGDDYANSPAALALLRRQLGGKIVGYMIYGDYSKPHPPSALIDAVARGDVDVAIAWGPLAGYFAKRSPVPLTLSNVKPAIDLPFTPFVFDIAIGVRRGDSTRRAWLDSGLVRHRAEIQKILSEFGVPLLATRVQ
jgi:quinoprotein dehydrogenase-associated probable ABC transporter substrate-binding protein